MGDVFGHSRLLATFRHCETATQKEEEAPRDLLLDDLPGEKSRGGLPRAFVLWKTPKSDQKTLEICPDYVLSLLKAWRKSRFAGTMKSSITTIKAAVASLTLLEVERRLVFC